jgi:hypothetical protein
MVGRHARLFACMDPSVGRFEVRRKELRVEQRRPRSIARKPLPDVPEPAGIVGHRNGQIFVLRRSLRNELGQVDCAQQARSHAAWKRIADASQYRQTRPQRIGRRGMGIIGQHIQEQVRQALPRQMVGR